MNPHDSCLSARPRRSLHVPPQMTEGKMERDCPVPMSPTSYIASAMSMRFTCTGIVWFLSLGMLSAYGGGRGFSLLPATTWRRWSGSAHPAAALSSSIACMPRHLELLFDSARPAQTVRTCRSVCRTMESGCRTSGVDPRAGWRTALQASAPDEYAVRGFQFCGGNGWNQQLRIVADAPTLSGIPPSSAKRLCGPAH